MSRAILELQGISRRYGATRALDGVHLTLRAGEIHGLIGENGAGKSTLIKVLGGLVTPDTGALRLHGEVLTGVGPRELARRGIAIIHQERLLPPNFTLAEALFFGQERRLGPLLDRRGQERAAERLLAERFGLDCRARTRVADLSSAEQQLLQISRALLGTPEVLVLDEPTVALAHGEVERLLTLLRQLRDQGLALLYVSHYLQEVERLCDRATVLRGGRVVAEVMPSVTPAAAMARLMINRELGEAYPKAQAAPGDVLLETRRLGRPGAFAEVDLQVRRGEVVGVAGLVGSGAKELLKTLFGLLPVAEGELLLDGCPHRFASPRAAVRAGLALLPENRRQQGVALDLTVTENLTLAALERFSRYGLRLPGAERRAAHGLRQALDIRTPDLDTPVRHLSGGNQQKVALGKWLARDARLYLLDEPSVGIDLAARAELYRQVARLVEQGAGVLILSVDLPELLNLCDRIHVMHRGRLLPARPAAELTAEELLAAATGAREWPARQQRRADLGLAS
ncbi:sugar ABC transporter ATP-binding protein [Pseudomonas oryzihabitans]|uniref:Sugar ABC transporter n=1 Tax=Pseudomonas oryzihabitans TaxID=47885 RepID=A0ABX3IRC1_9PSED|nr:sugar ABC transporter ATP-binding protein [Pseudomonas psychrotolerans]ONN70200.1 sugar ABC transporter [Pseudomonas psychrotolerans]